MMGAATAWIPKAAEAKAQRLKRRKELGESATISATSREKVKLMFRKAQRSDEGREAVLEGMQKALAALQSDVSEIKGGLTKLTDMVQGLVDRTL